MRLIEDEKRDFNDLPWVNEYINSVIGEEGDVSPVSKMFFTAKGLLVLTKDFKGFIFKESKTYRHIYDAIPHWKASPSLPFRLYAQALSSGKLAIAIEDTEDSVLIVDSSNGLSFKSSDGEDGSLGGDSTNPFIPNLPVPTTSGKTRRQKSTAG